MNYQAVGQMLRFEIFALWPNGTVILKHGLAIVQGHWKLCQ